MGKSTKVRMSALSRDYLSHSFPTSKLKVKKDVSSLSRGQRRRAEKHLKKAEKVAYSDCVLRTAEILNAESTSSSQKQVRSKKSAPSKNTNQSTRKGMAGVSLRDFRQFKAEMQSATAADTTGEGTASDGKLGKRHAVQTRKLRKEKEEHAVRFHNGIIGHKEYAQNPLGCLKNILQAGYMKK